MNAIQQANENLGLLLGNFGRAVWLGVNVDDVPVHVLAKELDVSVSRIKDTLNVCNWAVEEAQLAPEDVRTGTYHPCYEGFHQMGDG